MTANILLAPTSIEYLARLAKEINSKHCSNGFYTPHGRFNSAKVHEGRLLASFWGDSPVDITDSVESITSPHGSQICATRSAPIQVAYVWSRHTYKLTGLGAPKTLFKAGHFGDPKAEDPAIAAAVSANHARGLTIDMRSERIQRACTPNQALTVPVIENDHADHSTGIKVA